MNIQDDNAVKHYVPWDANTAKFGSTLVHRITGEKFILRGVKGHSMFVDHEEISPEYLCSNYLVLEDGRLRQCAEVLQIKNGPKVEEEKNKVVKLSLGKSSEEAAAE